MVDELFAPAAESLVYLIYLVVILLAGVVATIISKKLRIPNILLLLIFGITLGNMWYKGQFLIRFPTIFLSVISIIALAMIVFDASSKFKIREFDKLAMKVIKLTGVFFLLTFIFLTLFSKFIFNLDFWHAMIFSTLMAGTSPSVILFMFGKTKMKVLEILKVESIINTPLVVLFPVIILELWGKLSNVALSKFDIFLDQAQPFVVLFVVGTGAGVIMGLIGSRMMRNHYVQDVSPLALVTMALLTYVLAEKFGGNGVLAVTIMGLFYGNVYIKEKAKLFEFSEVFTNAFEVMVFILIGLIVHLPLNAAFFYKSILLFVIYLVIRYVSIEVSFEKNKLNRKEKFFMVLNVQKGIAVAVVVIFLSTISELTTVLHLALAFMLYSIVLSTISLLFINKLLGIEEKPV